MFFGLYNMPSYIHIFILLRSRRNKTCIIESTDLSYGDFIAPKQMCIQQNTLLLSLVGYSIRVTTRCLAVHECARSCFGRRSVGALDTLGALWCFLVFS
jgi:hypothetical protein